MRTIALIFCLMVSRMAGAANFYFDEAPFTTYGEHNPMPVFSTTAGGHTVKAIQPSGSIRFASTSTSVGINVYYSTAAGRTYVLLQDGVEVGSEDVPATGAGAYQTITLATGLSGEHEYEIHCITPIAGATDAWYDSHLVLDADSLAAVAHPPRFVWGFYGDSITNIGSATPAITDTRTGDMWQACQETGHAMAIYAPGFKVANTGRDSTAGIPADVDGVCVRYGINDAPDFPSGAATFRQAYEDMVDNIRTRIGAGKPIVCLRPLDTVADASTQMDIGTEIQAAISGKADVYYVDTAGWITRNTSHMPDGLHPNATGYAEMAAPLAETLEIYDGDGGGSVTVGTLTLGTLIIGAP
jgi:hypothetical protein